MTSGDGGGEDVERCNVVRARMYVSQMGGVIVVCGEGKDDERVRLRG